MAKFKVKKINGQYVVGKDIKTSYNSIEFTLPRYGTKIFKSKIAAQKRADKLNE